MKINQKKENKISIHNQSNIHDNKEIYGNKDSLRKNVAAVLMA